LIEWKKKRQKKKEKEEGEARAHLLADGGRGKNGKRRERRGGKRFHSYPWLDEGKGEEEREKEKGGRNTEREIISAFFAREPAWEKTGGKG